MGRELQTFLDYPALKPGASFNLDTLKAEMAEKMAQAEAASKGTGGITFTAGGSQGPPAFSLAYAHFKRNRRVRFARQADRQAQHGDNLRRSKVL
jgi:hypothetical protein